MFKDIKNRKELISTLEEFVYFAEKGTPLGENFPSFPEGRTGELLNRLAAVYRKTIHDRTSLHAAQEMVVKESQDNIRHKKQLTQNINHELKTPVSCINGYLETIIHNPELSEEQKMLFITKCYDQSQRLSHLLSDLSMITRMDEAGEMIEKEDISLSDLISAIVTDMLPMAQGKIDIRSDFPDGKMIYGNHFFLYSIFRNLLENAIFYSKGTSVTISLQEESADTYTICVQDDGVGIDSLHLTRIFERFYRIDKGRSRKLGGTGLGLSIVKNAVALHGGTIRATQASPSGLAFIFTLKK